MDVERAARKPAVAPRRDDDGYGRLVLKVMQIVFRLISALFELATVAFLGYVYDGWRREPSVRVDLLFPSFFPVVAAILMDFYEIMSLSILTRKRLINPVAVGFDVVVTGVAIFCFLVLGLTDFEGNQKSFGPGTTRSVWATDMNNAMIFMIVFCLLHAIFVVLSSGGYIYMTVHRKREKRTEQIARSQAEMVQFYARQQQQQAQGVLPGATNMGPMRPNFGHAWETVVGPRPATS
ncbi:hypothetical protein B0H66DRAFT_542245 [Apodospora peruviana]|uniref:Uncharacterized protein n=1 Tax=Apodospora peruviana TaxID=516989 RepID=A0AAE0IRB6_9PEZI|nr:hypothetical protein B0H66DRAFT_542245 [Apodospora peruviana]